MSKDKWISTKTILPSKTDGDEYGNVLAWRLGRAMIIKYDEVIPENASHWMHIPDKSIEE
jgi:hypothetical protein